MKLKEMWKIILLSFYKLKVKILSDDVIVIEINEFLSDNRDIIINSQSIRKFKTLKLNIESNEYHFELENSLIFEAIITEDGVSYANFRRKNSENALALIFLYKNLNKG